MEGIYSWHLFTKYGGEERVLATYSFLASDSYQRKVNQDFLHALSQTSERDSGYPYEPWLVTSVMHAEPDTLESHFNSCHMTTRNYVECCIGVWKEWFRIHHKSMCSFGQHSSLPQRVPLPQNIQMEDEEIIANVAGDTNII
ncbi:hypothetical protein J437_LFUL011977 [Ladona fulva]|uniref:Uncharacterized protein n=1 Tax=Ladona fulva TaxID=123851 RepID=A0A8K0KBX2_LADFU|nr:hypothetical protein J437_LFUL011977 [Ladona fulva]